MSTKSDRYDHAKTEPRSQCKQSFDFETNKQSLGQRIREDPRNSDRRIKSHGIDMLVIKRRSQRPSRLPVGSHSRFYPLLGYPR